MTARLIAFAFVAAQSAGCVDVAQSSCFDLVCPADAVCVDSLGYCVSGDRVAPCADEPDDTDCAYGGMPDGVCIGGVCFPRGCGDGRIEGAEDCEGGDLGGASCTDLGFYEPDGLACTDQCLFDTSGCRGWCGDGEINGDEQCDTDDLAGAQCTDLGFYDAAGLACSPVCNFDVLTCTGFCGDGEINGDEICDGAPPAGFCTDYGFDAGPISCSGQCGIGAGDCERFGWRPLQTPVIDTLRDVWMASEDDFWAVGDAGTVLHWNGVEWTEVDVGTTEHLEAVWSFDGATILVAGNAGTLIEFDGTAWSAIATDTTSDLRGIWGSAPDDVYVVGTDTTILHFDGTDWTAVATGDVGDLNGIWGSGPDDIHVVGQTSSFRAALLHFDGDAWTPRPLNGADLALADVTGTGPSQAVAVGLLNVMVYDGAEWTSISPRPIETWLRGVWARGPDDYYAVGWGGNILHYDGQHFRFFEFETGSDLDAVTGLPSGHVVAVGETGEVRVHDGPGWIVQNVLATPFLRDVFAFDANTAFGADSSGWLLRYTGSRWNVEHLDTALWGLWGPAPDDMFVVGNGIEHYDGTAWTPMASESGAWLLSVWGTAGDDVYAVGEAGTIEHYDGTAWQVEDHGLTIPGYLVAVDGSAATGEVFAVGEAGVIVHGDGAGAWSQMASPTTAELSDVWVNRPDDVYATSLAGEIIRYDGATWSIEPTPFIGSLLSIHGTGDDDIFAGESTGRLLHFDGTAWRPMRSRTSERIAAIAAVPDAVFFVGGARRTYLHRHAAP